MIICPCFNTLYVIGSNYLFQLQEVGYLRFNTLYVIGSIVKSPLLSVIVPLFQYIICNRFKLTPIQ